MVRVINLSAEDPSIVQIIPLVFQGNYITVAMSTAKWSLSENAELVFEY